MMAKGKISHIFSHLYSIRAFLRRLDCFYVALKTQKGEADKELVAIKEGTEPGSGAWTRQIGYCNGLEYALDGLKKIMGVEKE